MNNKITVYLLHILYFTNLKTPLRVPSLSGKGWDGAA